jgi:RNase P subunit RPR2
MEIYCPNCKQKISFEIKGEIGDKKEISVSCDECEKNYKVVLERDEGNSFNYKIMEV